MTALLDIRLPDSNDLQLLEEVRRRIPQCAVVLMTAFGTPDVAEDGVRLERIAAGDRTSDSARHGERILHR